MGDGQADFLGGFGTNGLLGASVLIDVTGDRGDSGGWRSAFEDE